MSSYQNINKMMNSDVIDKKSYFSELDNECEFNTILIPSLIFIMIFAMFFHIGFSFEVHKSNIVFFLNKLVFFSKSTFAFQQYIGT